MKLKKLLAGIMASTMALSSLAFSSSAAAGTITYKPTTGTTTYEMKVTAEARIATTDLKQGDSILIPGGYYGTNIIGSINGNTCTFKDIKFNGQTLTSGSVNVGIQAGSNQIFAGQYDKFTWTATATFTNGAHPANDLGMNVSSLSMPNFFISIPYRAPSSSTMSLTPVDFSNNITGVVQATSNEILISSDEYVYVNNFNNKNGLKIQEKEDIKKSSTIKVTARLKEPTKSYSIYYLYTDLGRTEAVTTTTNYGSSTITFDCPQKWFYQYKSPDAYSSGGDAWFTNMRIRGDYTTKFTQFDLYYSGTGANVVTPPSDDDEDAVDEESDFRLTTPEITLNVGTRFVLEPENGSKVKYKTSSKSTVIVYTNGAIKPQKTGTATITAINSDGTKATCKVRVISSSKPAPSTFKQTATKASATRNKAYTLRTNLASTSTDKITWYSNDSTIATISPKDSSGRSARLVTKAKGSVVITAVTSSGKISECVVTVK